MELRVCLDSPGYVSILEQPTALNEYRLVVESNDDYRGGLSWYNVEMSYSEVPIPGAAWLFGSGLALMMAIRLSLLAG